MLSRLYAKAPRLAPYIKSIELIHHPKAGPCLSLDLNKGDSEINFKVPLVWFRDHCKSGYDQFTDQRRSQMLHLTEEARITNRNAVKFDGDALSIKWSDGHTSIFDPDELININLRMNFIISGADPPLMHFQPSIFSFSEFAGKFVSHGIVAVEGIEPTIGATKQFAHEIAPFHDTFYGLVWTISNIDEDKENYYADSAYTNEEVGPHIDGSFFNQPPGVTVFHILRPSKEGGDTILVDAFAAAERLRNESPGAFDVLTTTLIDHHYIERGDNPLLSVAPQKPVIELDADGGYAQIRFNPYHRSPLRLEGNNGFQNPEQIVAFYQAYQAFTRICNDPSMALKTRLEPGTVLFIDNHRVLHARTAFSGYRLLCGSYLSRDGLMAKARPHVVQSVRLQI